MSVFELEFLVRDGSNILLADAYPQVEQRLDQLVRMGYATRRHLYTSPESGAPVYIYQPTQAGLDYLEELNNFDAEAYGNKDITEDLGL